MEQFTRIFQNATAAIEPVYFHLPVHGGDPVYRERVYCYELYHQMRRQWPQDEQPYRLNGEIDKRAHPYFEEAAAPKPDLLVHEPGFGNNYAVIEVKSCHADKDGIIKDLETLTRFVREFGYRRAIYLIYGTKAARTMVAVQRFATEMTNIAPIKLWTHTEALKPSQAVPLLPIQGLGHAG